MPRSEFDRIELGAAGEVVVEGPAEAMGDKKVLWVIEQGGRVTAGLATPDKERFRDTEALPPEPWAVGQPANAFGVLLGPHPAASELTFWFQRLPVSPPQ